MLSLEKNLHDNSSLNGINNDTNSDYINVYKHNIDDRALWKSGSTLIIGDSILNGLDESRLRNCKVRVYPGASLEDMHYNIVPQLRKKPTNIILHAGTNNCINHNSRQIIEKLLSLKDFILRRLPNCRIIFSSLIYRCDDAKALP